MRLSARAKLPRRARLCGLAQFTGKFSSRRQGIYFSISIRANTDDKPARLGVVAGRHAVPRAVTRVRMKRTVREVFRQLRGGLGSVDVVVKVRRGAQPSEIPDARRELEKLLVTGR